VGVPTAARTRAHNRSIDHTLDHTRRAISDLLFLKDEPGTVDLTLVLGNNYEPSMEPAIELFHAGLTPAILITGGWHGEPLGRPSEARRFAAYAQERGVPESALVLEERASNTLENFAFTRDIVEERWGWEAVRQVAIVCLSFHTRRALMTAQAHWPADVSYLFLPVIDRRNIGQNTWWLTEEGRKRVMAELRRIGEYGLKGDLAV
jgi:uncharacterized SAM-binding protein YcdF (DUF218 family)